MPKLVHNDQEISGTVDSAEKVIYDNSNSGLEATNVQDAIDETSEKLNDVNAVMIGYPDFSKITKIINGSGSYTVTESGYINAYVNSSDGSVKINGITVFYGNGLDITFPPTPVKVGDVVSSTLVKESSVSFMPFIK